MLVTVGVMLVTMRVAAAHACYSASHACYHEGLDLFPWFTALSCLKLQTVGPGSTQTLGPSIGSLSSRNIDQHLMN